MAATSTVHGRFAAIAHKTWDEFTDKRTGEVVKAGQSLTVYTVDPDGELDTMKVPAEKIDGVLPTVQALAFGDEIVAAVKVNRWGMTLANIEKSNKPVRAAS